MKRFARITRLVAFVSATALMFVGGCTRQSEQPALTPKVAPPVIKQAGVLKVAIDPSQPPFGGDVDGQTVGLDVDVAAAVAERLGLKVELVKMTYTDIPSAVKNGTVDLGLGGIPLTDAVLADVSVAGSYATDGIALFAAAATGTVDVTATVTPQDVVALLGDASVGCQGGSAAQWRLESEFWEGYATTYETLRQAFDALEAGEVDFVACDAFVGAYLARDHDTIQYVGLIGDVEPLGALVAKDSSDLEKAVREVLDAMAADGTLAAIRSKWVGGLPELRAAGSADATEAVQ